MALRLGNTAPKKRQSGGESFVTCFFFLGKISVIVQIKFVKAENSKAILVN